MGSRHSRSRFWRECSSTRPVRAQIRRQTASPSDQQTARRPPVSQRTPASGGLRRGRAAAHMSLHQIPELARMPCTAMAALTNPTVNSYKRLGARTTASGATWSPTAATCARHPSSKRGGAPPGPAFSRQLHRGPPTCTCTCGVSLRPSLRKPCCHLLPVCHEKQRRWAGNNRTALVRVPGGATAWQKCRLGGATAGHQRLMRVHLKA